ncbi:MAG: hypothetical protein R3C39_14395 [Dehalococcoidia bacterium]
MDLILRIAAIVALIVGAALTAAHGIAIFRTPERAKYAPFPRDWFPDWLVRSDPMTRRLAPVELALGMALAALQLAIAWALVSG